MPYKKGAIFVEKTALISYSFHYLTNFEKTYGEIMLADLSDPQMVRFPQEGQKETPPSDPAALEAMLKEISNGKNGENGNIAFPKDPPVTTIGLDGSPPPTNVGINFANPDKTVTTSSFTPPKDEVSAVSVATTPESGIATDTNQKTR